MKTCIASFSRRSALQCLGMGAIAPLLPASVAIAQSPSAAAFSRSESAPTLTDGTRHLCLELGEGRLFRLQIE